MRITTIAAALTLAAAPLAAQPPAASPSLADIGFLVGDWQAGAGQVAETGGTSKGRSTITREANGQVLLRRDHTDLFTSAGAPAGGFDQIMMIYPEGGTLHADYSDGTHVIHYVRAEASAGRAVSFTSAARPDAPSFRLDYRLADAKTLAIRFAMAPPGSSAFHPIATGTLTRAP